MLGRSILTDRTFTIQLTTAGHAAALWEWTHTSFCAKHLSSSLFLFLSVFLRFTERKCPVFKQEMSTAVMLQPIYAPRRLLPPVSRWRRDGKRDAHKKQLQIHTSYNIMRCVSIQTLCWGRYSASTKLNFSPILVHFTKLQPLFC